MKGVTHFELSVQNELTEGVGLVIATGSGLITARASGSGAGVPKQLIKMFWVTCPAL